MRKDYSKQIAAAVALCAATLWTASRLQAFNPQPDPPAMAAIQMLTSETAKLYAHCSAQAAHGVNPGPCAVLLQFRDEQGNVVKSTATPLALRPGQTGILELDGREMVHSTLSLVLAPEVLPDRGRIVVASVQVVDTLTGKTSLYSGPAAPRLSFFATE